MFKVKFYNINSPHNRELIKKSLPLEDYCVIIEKYLENKNQGMKEEKAFYEAYKYCMATRNWMLDFLKLHEWELYDMISTEYNEEWAMAAQRAEGREEGREEGKLEVLKNMLAMKMSVDDIAKIIGWSKEKILKLVDDIHAGVV